MGAISEALKEGNENGCAFIKICKVLDTEDNDAIIRAINNGSSGYVIANALHKGGYKIAASTVSLHLRSLCSCAYIKVK